MPPGLYGHWEMIRKSNSAGFCSQVMVLCPRVHVAHNVPRETGHNFLAEKVTFGIRSI